MTIPLAEVKAQLLSNPRVRQAYDSLEEEYLLLDQLALARERAKLSQVQCARRMQTTQSVVARLESGRQSPSLRSLRRYAAAVGCRLEIRLVPLDKKPKKSS